MKIDLNQYAAIQAETLKKLNNNQSNTAAFIEKLLKIGANNESQY